jgi:glycosyltransferase involved in cell wall biosynthesis
MHTLRIGIDGRPLQGNRRGDGRYVFELCKRIDAFMPKAKFFVYSSVPVEMPVLSDRWVLRNDRFPFSKFSPLLWLKLRGCCFCRRDHLDVFWGTNVFLPMLPHTVKKVVTVHDFRFLVAPETFIKLHFLANRLFFKNDILKADIILANSEGTSKRIHDLMALQSTVMRPAVGKVFKPQTSQQIENSLKSYGINFPYLLNVAVWDPIKNIELLVRTFINMKNQGLLPKHKMVLVGGKGWKYRSLTSMVSIDGGKNIVSLGYVSDKDLASLYAGADLFIFPSIYEGFGIPVLEARASGARVVTTDIPELREAGGPDAIYIKPTERGIRNGILAALEQPPPTPDFDNSPKWEQGALILVDALQGKLPSH